MNATTLFLLPSSLLSPKLPTLFTTTSSHLIPTTLSFSSSIRHKPKHLPTPRFDFRVWANDDDGDSGGPDEYDTDENDDEVEEVDNKKDYDVEYDTLALTTALRADDEIAMIHSKSFMSTQGWDSEMIVDYRINEDEFHKIKLLDCDFFIRKPPDPDNDVFDFREMYVTPPDTDIYSIPRVLAPMPQKYIRCAKSDYGWYHVTEPPIDAPRDPMYKSEWEVSKVFLTKHYRNRRLGDSEFVLDFEEIYVIDSKNKVNYKGKSCGNISVPPRLLQPPLDIHNSLFETIKHAFDDVTVPEGRNRDRKQDLLVVRDNGNSFKIIPLSEKEDPTTVIEKEEWNKTRQDMERHLRKLRDFSTSNWF